MFFLGSCSYHLSSMCSGFSRSHIFGCNVDEVKLWLYFPPRYTNLMYRNLFYFLDAIVGVNWCVLFQEWIPQCLVTEPTGEQNLTLHFSASHINKHIIHFCLLQTSGLNISIVDTTIIIMSTILSIAFHEFGHAIAAARSLCLTFSFLFFSLLDVACFLFSSPGTQNICKRGKQAANSGFIMRE